MREWKEFKLKDIVSGFFDGPHATPKESESGAVFLGIKNITEDGRIDLSDTRHIALDDMPKWTKRVTPSEGDIVFSYEATLHRYAMIPKGFHGCLGRRMALIRVNENKADKKFIFQYMFSPAWRKEVERNIMTGATVDRIPLTNVPDFNIHLPPLPTQRRIASILSAYDDLIENNLRRIKLLEELAQRTYEEWFVKRIVGTETHLGALIAHEIGGGWGEDIQSEEFNTSAYVIRGTDFDNIPIGNIGNVPFRFHKSSNLASRKLEDGDILFEVSGGSQNEGVAKTLLITNNLLRQFNDDLMCASFCKLVRPVSRDTSNFIFLFLKFLRKARATEVYEIRSASNIVNYNWSAFLKFQKVNLPDDEALQKFNKIINPIFDQIYQLGYQNRHLKTSRDLLLPRLMSGEVEV